MTGSAALLLAPQTLVGLLCVVGRVARLPPRCWPMEVALSHLRDVADETGAIGSALSRWPLWLARGGPYAGVDRVIRDLARLRILTPEGEGWHAGYAPSRSWLDANDRLLWSMAQADRASVRRGGQALRAALNTWSKNAIASGPSGLGTTWSSTTLRQAESR